MQANPEAMEGQVAVQLHSLVKAVDAVDVSVEGLEERLAPVLRGEPGVAKVADVPQQELVPLADAVRAQAQRIERQADRLRQLRTRIEL